LSLSAVTANEDAAGRPDTGVPAGELRLMAVHAHPDDESSKGAATMARYVAEGASVLVCTLTGGERGDILNKAMESPEVRANLPAIRRREMDRAREILGVQQRFLGFTDSGLPEGDPLPPLPEGCFGLVPLAEAARPLVQAVREFRPHVILTYDENGGYPHPDHIKTHQVAVEAFEAGADPDRYPGCGEPWQPLKLYYFAAPYRERLIVLHEEMLRRGLKSPFEERIEKWRSGVEEDRPGRPSRPARPRHPVTTRVTCGDYFPLRDQALLAHATQIDPTGSWFDCSAEIQAAVWPTEDYYLARSVADLGVVDTGPNEPAGLEDDLFAGIRERVSL
jgi:mycothiol S-conjugate amidase